MSTYSLQLDEETAEIVMKALDLYSRVGVGQIDSLLRHPEVERQLERGSRHGISYQMARFKESVFGFGHCSISSPVVLASTKRAYDLFSVIRHRLAWDRKGNPATRDETMLSVEFDQPVHEARDRPLPVIERLEKK